MTSYKAELAACDDIVRQILHLDGGSCNAALLEVVAGEVHAQRRLDPHCGLVALCPYCFPAMLDESGGAPIHQCQALVSDSNRANELSISNKCLTGCCASEQVKHTNCL